jgi:hypothetical protein
MRNPYRRRRPVGSTLEAIEARQLLSTLARPSAIAPPAAVEAPATGAADAPRLASVQLEPLTGRVLVTITGDLAGIDRAKLTDPRNYSLVPVVVRDEGPAVDPSRPEKGVILVPNFVTTGVALTPNPGPGLPRSLVVSINNNQPLRAGFYRFRINSAGITDGSGVALDGAYRGVFPSGNGRPGSDFVADLAVLHNSVQPALPVAPLPQPAGPHGVKPSPIFFPTTRQIRIRIMGNNNPDTRQKGGGNAIAVALPHQSIPARYRLPETVGGRSIRPVLDPPRWFR